MKRAMKWGSNIITGILAVILLLTMYFALSSHFSGGTPKIFGYQMYEVLSGSMEPGIHTGSVIFDTPHVDTKALKQGDVITFHAPDNASMLITHRINKVVQDGSNLSFQTKGDANDAPDASLVPADHVVAKYAKFTIPYLGFYLNFIKTKLGIALLLVVPGVLLVISTIVSLFREIAKVDKEKAVDTEAPTATIADSASVAEARQGQ